MNCKQLVTCYCHEQQFTHSNKSTEGMNASHNTCSINPENYLCSSCYTTYFLFVFPYPFLTLPNILLWPYLSFLNKDTSQFLIKSTKENQFWFWLTLYFMKCIIGKNLIKFVLSDYFPTDVLYFLSIFPVSDFYRKTF